MKRKDMPLGVKILSVLAYITATFTLIGAIAMFVGSSFIASILPSGLNILGLAVGATLGVIFLAFAVLDYFIARGLWLGQEWTRIVVLIVAAIGAIGSLIALFAGDFTSILSIAINGLVIYYLGFIPEVKKAFS